MQPGAAGVAIRGGGHASRRIARRAGRAQDGEHLSSERLCEGHRQLVREPATKLQMGLQRRVQRAAQLPRVGASRQGAAKPGALDSRSAMRQTPRYGPAVMALYPATSMVSTNFTGST